MPGRARAAASGKGVTMVRTWLVVAVLIGLGCVGGCGADLAAVGGGAAGGWAASETVKGIEKDLEQRERILVKRYAEAVEANAQAEQLQRIENQIRDVNDVRQSVTVIKQAAGTDWKDQGAAAGMVGTIAATAAAIFLKRRLGKTEAGVNRFMSKNDAATSQGLLDEIARKKSGA